MESIYRVGITGICIFIWLNGIAQKKVDLEKIKYKTEQEIQYSTKLLEETQKSAKNTLDKLSVLNYQIDKRVSLIQNLEEEVEGLDNETEEYDRIINAMNEDLEQMKQEYIKVLRYSSMIQNRQEILMFLLASDNVSQAYNRMIYVKRYAEFRTNQALLIEKTVKEIETKKSELVRLKAMKSIAISQKEKENGKLKDEVKQKGQLVKSLKRKENDLRQRIREKERIARELERQIEKMLEEERSKVKNSVEIVMTPEEKVISGDFQKNRGRLPWPTEKGIITGRYGKQEHPLIKNTMIQNNGIDITTESKSNVRALYDGVVTKVVAILGANYTVIIKHGNFYSVYQNLIDVNVTKGQKVKMKQKIGVVDDGKGEASSVLHLEIWQNFSRMNPEEWLTN